MTQDPSETAAAEITCREVAAWTSEYLDAHLHEPAKVRMALHLASCAGCRAYVEQIAAVRDVVGSLPKDGPDIERLEQLRRAFAARRPH